MGVGCVETPEHQEPLPKAKGSGRIRQWDLL